MSLPCSFLFFKWTFWLDNVRHIFHKLFYSVLLLGVLASSACAQEAADYSDLSRWQTIKGKHFIVYFYNKQQSSIASRVLNEAEGYYDKVAYQIGYSRYSDFWTWEDRVKIFIFPDRLSFVMTTGQKEWSKGYAVRDSKLFESRAIVTYNQEESFIDNLLPHEIAHLIVKDFIGFEKSLPLWFDEGIAQQQETPDAAEEEGMTRLAKDGQYIPFDIFQNLDIRQETDEFKVAVFYAQSRSVVEFLIRVYGQESFQRFCINLRDGMDFAEALGHAYPATIDSVATLGAKWAGHMQQK